MQLVRLERAPLAERNVAVARPAPRVIDVVPIVVTIVRVGPPVSALRRAIAAYEPATEGSRLLAIA